MSVLSLTKDFPAPPEGRSGWPWVSGAQPLSEVSPAGKPWPVISVITPSFNQGPFIEETIRSVLLQGYPRLEFIVIDGGSTDNSVDTIRKYGPWITYWVSEPDGGQTYAINKGIRIATGDVLSWLNSDDILCPDALREVAEKFIESPDLELVYGDCEMIDENGDVFDRFNVRKSDLTDLLEENFISQPSTFFRARALAAVGGLDSELHYAMDYDLWIRMFLNKARVLYNPTVLSRFRYHGTSKSGIKSVQFGYEVLRLLDKIDKDAHGSLIPELLKAYHRTFGIIIDLHRQTASNDRAFRIFVTELLDMWIMHIEENRHYYASVPVLLAQSNYSIGNQYCLIDRLREGRRYFGKALRTHHTFKKKGFLAWAATFFGTAPFKWRCRDEANSQGHHSRS